MAAFRARYPNCRSSVLSRLSLATSARAVSIRPPASGVVAGAGLQGDPAIPQALKDRLTTAETRRQVGEIATEEMMAGQALLQLRLQLEQPPAGRRVIKCDDRLQLGLGEVSARGSKRWAGPRARSDAGERPRGDGLDAGRRDARPVGES
jgi:hypothetical protein